MTAHQTVFAFPVNQETSQKKKISLIQLFKEVLDGLTERQLAPMISSDRQMYTKYFCMK